VSVSVRRGSFIGREAELARLHELRRVSCAGSGALVLIGGEAGIGKTRLLNEFVRAVTGGRAPLFAFSECLERAARPFGPFREIFARFADAVPDVISSLAPLPLQAMQHLLPAANFGPSAPALEKADLFRGVRAVFAAVSQHRAAIVVIEDLHWADAATLEVLEYLAPRVTGHRIMLIATLRDDVLLAGSPLTAALGRLERAPNVHAVPVRPLARSMVRKLLESTLDGGALGAEVLDDIERRSEGNPLFAEELLKSRLERGPHNNDLPRSISTLIEERFAQLDDGARRMLVAAAVLGQRFDAKILASIVACDVDEVALVLRRACDLNLVRETGTPNGFHFRHALTRQALYESQLSLSVRPLHARIARVIEARPDAAERLDELAYHWWQAEDTSKARLYNERAAAAALSAFAFADAVTYLQRALSLCDDPLERARLLSELGAAQRSNGNPDAAVTWCLAATDSFTARGEYGRAIAPLMFAAAELANDDRLGEALSLLAGFAVEHGAGLDASDYALFRSEQLLLETARIDRDPADVLERFDPPIDLLQGEAQLRYWTARSFAYALSGELARWRRAVEKLEEHLAGSTSSRVLLRGSARQFIILGALHLGQRRESERMIHATRDFMTTHALRPQGAYTEALAALDGYLTGRLAEARLAARYAADHVRFSIARAVTGWAGPLIGLALDDERLIDDTLYEQAGRNVVARGIQTHADLAAGAVAAVLVARNQTDEARRVLEAAVDSFAVFVQGELIWPLAARYVDVAHLRLLVERLNRIRENAEHPSAHAVAALVESIASRRAGDALRSHRFAEEAVRRFHDIGWPLFEAQAFELLDRVDDARAIYKRCGSIADVRRLAMPAPGAAGRRQAAPDSAVLSRREREVAELVAAGHTNRLVADRLGIGEKTVEKHVGSIYTKLGFRSRATLAAFVGDAKSRAASVARSRSGTPGTPR
jgi:DNA-binding CsgD family transcriptional regulator